MTRTHVAEAVVCLSACVMLTACTAAKPTSTTAYKPSSLSTVTGAPDTHLVTLTAVAAQRIGLKTVAVGQDATSRTVPSEAALFGPGGRSFVYAATSELTFQRVEITVLADDGKITRFTDGPAPGTLVVTTGVVEVYGAEFEVAH